MRTSLPLDGARLHPRELCESDEVGQATCVWAFAHVLAGARIGSDRNICEGAFVENGASVDFVAVRNQVMIFEGVHMANYVFLGPASAVAIPEASSPAVVR